MPDELDDRLEAKLLKYYDKKLIDDPTAHDKIEFEIAFSEYEFRLSSEKLSPEEVSERFDKMMSLEKIEAEKHSKKKGMILIDIKPHINAISKEIGDNVVVLTVRLPAGQELNINSNVFIEALQKYCGIDDLGVSTKRTKILKNNGELFV